MTAPEEEVTIEIVCTDPPEAAWPAGGVLNLGIQKEQRIESAASVAAAPLLFQPRFRVRRHADGSANFLGPFAHGPRSERFIYLNWIVKHNGVAIATPGRIKLHLSHIPWRSIEAAVSADKPIRVSLALSNAAGKPVYASLRTGVRWDL